MHCQLVELTCLVELQRISSEERTTVHSRRAPICAGRHRWGCIRRGVPAEPPAYLSRFTVGATLGFCGEERCSFFRKSGAHWTRPAICESSRAYHFVTDRASGMGYSAVSSIRPKVWVVPTDFRYPDDMGDSAVGPSRRRMD